MTSRFSAGHEREERRKMNRGFWHSAFGIALSPVPFVGLLFSISGFLRQVVRITRKHRFRNVIFTFFALISLLTSVSILAAEAYAFSRDPTVVDRVLRIAWESVTGQTEYPWEAPKTPDGVDYGDSERPGLGIFEGEGDSEMHEGEGIEIDLDMLPDLESIMEDIRNPFAHYLL